MSSIQLDLAAVNKILAALETGGPGDYSDGMPSKSGLKSAGITLHSRRDGHQGLGSYGEAMGEYNESVYYYQTDLLPEGVFIKVVSKTDSYDSNETVTLIQFVEGKKKEVTVFEPV